MENVEEPYTKKDVYDWLEDGNTLEERDLSRGQLIGIHLPKLNLKGASFQDADVRYSNLAGANLENANLKGANLEGTRLTGANLAGANLEGAIVDKVNLWRADLKEACLRNATLIHASLRATRVDNVDFSNANLQGANLSGAKGCLSAKFDNANLRGVIAKFTGLDGRELGDVGAKIDSTSEDGLKTRVFDFFQVDEKPKNRLKKIVSSVFHGSTKIAKKIIPKKK